MEEIAIPWLALPLSDDLLEGKNNISKKRLMEDLLSCYVAASTIWSPRNLAAIFQCQNPVTAARLLRDIIFSINGSLI